MEITSTILPGHQNQSPIGVPYVGCMPTCCGRVEDAMWAQVGCSPSWLDIVVAWKLLGHSHSCLGGERRILK